MGYEINESYKKLNLLSQILLHRKVQFMRVKIKKTVEKRKNYARSTMSSSSSEQ